jgi:hypothetical protein
VMTLLPKVIVRRNLAPIYLDPSARRQTLELLRLRDISSSNRLRRMKGVIVYDFGGRTGAGSGVREVRAKYRGARASTLAGGFRPEHGRAKSNSRGRVKKQASQNARRGP